MIKARAIRTQKMSGLSGLNASQTKTTLKLDRKA